MNWLSFLLALVHLVSEIIKWSASQQTSKTTAVIALRKAVQSSRLDVNHANSVQDHLRSELDAHPERLREDDGFSRD